MTGSPVSRRAKAPYDTVASSNISLGRNVDRIVNTKWSSFDPLFERLAVVVGHHEIELPVVGLADLVDRTDIGVVQGRGRLGTMRRCSEIQNTAQIVGLISANLAADQSAKIGQRRTVDGDLGSPGEEV